MTESLRISSIKNRKSQIKNGPWRLWIDTGGTFTDCLIQTPKGEWERLKVLSAGCVRASVEKSAPGNLTLRGLPPVPPNFFRGYQLRVDGREYAICGSDSNGHFRLGGKNRGTLSPGAIVELSAQEEPPVLAARLATGTRLDQTLPPLELRIATTRGTNALLEFKGRPPAFFVTKGFGDLLRIGNQQRPELFALNIQKTVPLTGAVFEVPERTDARGKSVRTFAAAAFRQLARQARRAGYETATVAFLHSYLNPKTERAAGRILREEGFQIIALSHALSARIKLLPRATTAVLDAYLAPLLNDYLDGIRRAAPRAQLEVMTSAGALVPRVRFCAKDSLLSGPAGGLAGAAEVAAGAGYRRLITFDMGGTSTDVARFEGEFERGFEHRIGSTRVFAPALKIESVAAGGGSICVHDGIRLRVGPESAGANPGPACYGRGGPLTLTDLNLLLGRLDPKRFGVPIDVAAAQKAFDQLHRQVGGTAEALQHGLIQIADERMAASIRQVTASEGHDAADYPLVAFGGAGGLHACGVAERLEMARILFPADSGLLSARGLRTARREAFAERQILRPLSEVAVQLPEWSAALRREAEEQVARPKTQHRSEIELRLAGQEAALVLPLTKVAKLPAAFVRVYAERFGYRPEKPVIEVVSLRVNAGETPPRVSPETFFPRRRKIAKGPMDRAALSAGDYFKGPAVVQDAFSSLYVAEGWKAVTGTRGSILLERAARRSRRQAGSRAIRLELMQNRLEAIVEEMGSLLRRTAISTNVKERLDFSCALLDAAGRLIVNAPHIPVHLGALGLCVRRVAAQISLGPGDVAVTNHPGFGGSHLPDVTIIEAVFDAAGRRIGYVANRAHHAEIGGLLPGSMPPAAKNLEEEGVVIPPMHLIQNGRSEFAAVEKQLRDARYPSRRVAENLADLRAQVASARRGAELLRELAVAEKGVNRLFADIRNRSAHALAAQLKIRGNFSRSAEEFLDDGSRLAVSVVHQDGRFHFDFTGTAERHPGNLNATPAILRSVVLYVLRLMIPEPLPLNEGLLSHVKITLPRGLLNPAFPPDPAKCPPVVGGNTDTSQRLTDTLIKALGLAACSQGTMNNFLFGDATRSYYETIGGGAGAGPGFAGADAVHTHMTNTAITDPEILELRYPVRLRRFGIRKNSGGAGQWRGGDGILRELEFLEPCEVSLLTQHRKEIPYGMESAEAGKCGVQTLILKNGTRRKLPSLAHFTARKGDSLRIETPGGGGWGKPGKV